VDGAGAPVHPDVHVDVAAVAFHVPEASGDQGHEFVPLPFDAARHGAQFVGQATLADDRRHPGLGMADRRVLIQRNNGKFQNGRHGAPLLVRALRKPDRHCCRYDYHAIDFFKKLLPSVFRQSIAE